MTQVTYENYTTQISYDGYDRMRGVRDPLNNETVISRSEFGNLLTIRRLDPAQNIIRESVQVNDPMGRVAARTEKLLDAAGQVVEEITYQYQYTEGGRVITIIDPLGRQSQVVKNELGWVVKEIDAAGNEVEYYYEDGRANMTKRVEKEKRADGGVDEFTTEYVYNAFNKVEKITDSLGNEWTFTYNERGLMTGSLDAEGNTITHEYDALGRKLKTEKHMLNGQKSVTEFTYDMSNNIKTIKDAAGNITSYDYDPLNRLQKVTYPDTTFVEYTYDLNSNVWTEKQRNGTIVTNDYDGLNRLTGRSIAQAAGVGGTTIESYEYDPLSRLVRAEDNDSVVEYEYDSLNRVTEETQNGKPVRYTYDAVSNRTSVQYPNSRIIEREFDVLNRIARVKEGADVMADFGFAGRAYRMVSKAYGNGDTVANLYDLGRRMIGREARNLNSDIINLYAYGYNKVHMKTFEQRQHDGGVGDAYGYDEFYRLASVKFNASDPTVPDPGEFERSKSYAFDKVDNILNIVKTQNEQTDTMQTQVNNLNQYTQFDAESLAYDANGNLKDKGGDSFIYDYRNQLVSANVDAQAVDFKYDALGRRIEKSAGGGAVRFYYDGNQVIEERDGSDSVLVQYMYGNGIDEIVRMDKWEGGSPVPYYYHTNSIGSVTTITDSAGSLVERITYDDYGNPTFIDHKTDPQNPTEVPASLIANPYLFQGRRFDPETSLYYYRARYFDPHIARFLQTDPKGYTDSLNLYQAFGQSPANFVDPWGTKIIQPEEEALVKALSALYNVERGKILYDILEESSIKFFIESGELPLGRIGEFKTERRDNEYVGVIYINVEFLEKRTSLFGKRWWEKFIREGAEVSEELIKKNEALANFIRFKDLQTIYDVIAEIMGHEFAHAAQRSLNWEQNMKEYQTVKFKEIIRKKIIKTGLWDKFRRGEINTNKLIIAYKDLLNEISQIENNILEEEVRIAYPNEWEIYKQLTDWYKK